MLFDEKQNGFKVFNGDDNFSGRGKINLKSRSFLFLSVFLMLAGFVVIFLGNTFFFILDGQENASNPTGFILLLIGTIINFFCVPILYWSSLEKFKKNDAFWDSEVFWILPLFFFGSFFQYISGLPYMAVILPFSLISIFFVHIWVMISSQRLISKDEQFENTVEYFKSITYLTAYYLIIVIVVVSFDLFGKFEYWLS